jgi:hypothetical protein
MNFIWQEGRFQYLRYSDAGIKGDSGRYPAAFQAGIRKGSGRDQVLLCQRSGQRLVRKT